MKTRMIVLAALVLAALAPAYAGDAPEREVGAGRTVRSWYVTSPNQGDGYLVEQIERAKPAERSYRSPALMGYTVAYVEGNLKYATTLSGRPVPAEVSSLLAQLAGQASVVRLDKGVLTVKLYPGDSWEETRKDIISGVLEIQLSWLGIEDYKLGWDSSAVCK